jgi:oxygen-independent coproporphyrinogen-3 oxidase
VAGIYIHIPFCKQKCSYCDFHFSTSLKYKSSLIDAIVKEIESKKEVLSEPISSIYFGGGTPSLLTEGELFLIMDALSRSFSITQNVEITFECNPDDISKKKLNELKQAGVNRLSIGIQSFFEDDLRLFNRAHNTKQAKESVLLSQETGFENITVDLIYGSPLLTLKKWEDNLNHIEQLNIPHLSAYTLTVEPNTALHHQVKTNQLHLPSDEQAITQFKLLIEKTKSFGLTQYEISNFGKEGFYSFHNSNYWLGIEYLGIGPSAHSFIRSPLSDASKRFWNVSHNMKYIKAINENTDYCEEELIDETTAYNEYILTRLRTIWGIDTEYISNHFNNEIVIHFNKELEKYSNSSYLQVSNNKITLTEEGIFIADKISSDLFLIK